MLATLSEVVRNIVVLIILVTILELVLPKSEFRPFVNMVVGLVLMLLLLSPLRSMLQIPWALDPVWEMHMSVSQADIDARQRILDEMNWELVLVQYRGQIEQRVANLLKAEGLDVVQMSFLVEEDINHMEFGQPRWVSALVKQSENAVEGIERVERVRVEIGAQEAKIPQEELRDGGLEAMVADALGLLKENVEVRVLNHE